MGLRLATLRAAGAPLQLPVKNVASILQRTFLGEKNILKSNERKVIRSDCNLASNYSYYRGRAIPTK